MTLVFALLIGASIALGSWFAWELGAPWRSGAPMMAWLQAALAWVTVAFDATLLAALFRVHVPPWVYGVILLAQDVVFGWRLVMLRRARQIDLVSD